MTAAASPIALPVQVIISLIAALSPAVTALDALTGWRGPHGCKEGWKAADGNGGCFLRLNTPMTEWQDAADACVAVGGTLASLRSPLEDAVAQWLCQSMSSGWPVQDPPDGSCWFGARWHNGVWRFADDGAPITRRNFGMDVEMDQTADVCGYLSVWSSGWEHGGCGASDGAPSGGRFPLCRRDPTRNDGASPRTYVQRATCMGGGCEAVATFDEFLESATDQVVRATLSVSLTMIDMNSPAKGVDEVSADGTVLSHSAGCLHDGWPASCDTTSREICDLASDDVTNAATDGTVTVTVRASASTSTACATYNPDVSLEAWVYLSVATLREPEKPVATVDAQSGGTLHVSWPWPNAGGSALSSFEASASVAATATTAATQVDVALDLTTEPDGDDPLAAATWRAQSALARLFSSLEIVTASSGTAAHTASCPAGKSIAFGYALQWGTGLVSPRPCLAENNKACPVGATSCSQSACCDWIDAAVGEMWVGGDELMSTASITSLSECEDACCADAACSYYTWDSDTTSCTQYFGWAEATGSSPSAVVRSAAKAGLCTMEPDRCAPTTTSRPSCEWEVVGENNNEAWTGNGQQIGYRDQWSWAGGTGSQTACAGWACEMSADYWVYNPGNYECWLYGGVDSFATGTWLDFGSPFDWVSGRVPQPQCYWEHAAGGMMFSGGTIVATLTLQGGDFGLCEAITCERTGTHYTWNPSQEECVVYSIEDPLQLLEVAAAGDIQRSGRVVDECGWEFAAAEFEFQGGSQIAYFPFDSNGVVEDCQARACEDSLVTYYIFDTSSFECWLYEGDEASLFESMGSAQRLSAKKGEGVYSSDTGDEGDQPQCQWSVTTSGQRFSGGAEILSVELGPEGVHESCQEVACDTITQPEAGAHPGHYYIFDTNTRMCNVYEIASETAPSIEAGNPSEISGSWIGCQGCPYTGPTCAVDEAGFSYVYAGGTQLGSSEFLDADATELDCQRIACEKQESEGGGPARSGQPIVYYIWDPQGLMCTVYQMSDASAQPWLNTGSNGDELSGKLVPTGLYTAQPPSAAGSRQIWLACAATDAVEHAAAAQVHAFASDNPDSLSVNCGVDSSILFGFTAWSSSASLYECGLDNFAACPVGMSSCSVPSLPCGSVSSSQAMVYALCTELDTAALGVLGVEVVAATTASDGGAVLASCDSSGSGDRVVAFGTQVALSEDTGATDARWCSSGTMTSKCDPGAASCGTSASCGANDFADEAVGVAVLCSDPWLLRPTANATLAGLPVSGEDEELVATVTVTATSQASSMSTDSDDVHIRLPAAPNAPSPTSAPAIVDASGGAITARWSVPEDTGGSAVEDASYALHVVEGACPDCSGSDGGALPAACAGESGATVPRQGLIVQLDAGSPASLSPSPSDGGTWHSTVGDATARLAGSAQESGWLTAAGAMSDDQALTGEASEEVYTPSVQFDPPLEGVSAIRVVVPAVDDSGCCASNRIVSISNIEVLGVPSGAPPGSPLRQLASRPAAVEASTYSDMAWAVTDNDCWASCYFVAAAAMSSATTWLNTGQLDTWASTGDGNKNREWVSILIDSEGATVDRVSVRFAGMGSMPEEWSIEYKLAGSLASSIVDDAGGAVQLNSPSPPPGPAPPQPAIDSGRLPAIHDTDSIAGQRLHVSDVPELNTIAVADVLPQHTISAWVKLLQPGPEMSPSRPGTPPMRLVEWPRWGSALVAEAPFLGIGSANEGAWSDGTRRGAAGAVGAGCVPYKREEEDAGSYPIPVDEWVHLTGVFGMDGSVTSYINGERVASCAVDWEEASVLRVSPSLAPRPVTAVWELPLDGEGNPRGQVLRSRMAAVRDAPTALSDDGPPMGWLDADGTAELPVGWAPLRSANTMPGYIVGEHIDTLDLGWIGHVHAFLEIVDEAAAPRIAMVDTDGGNYNDVFHSAPLISAAVIAPQRRLVASHPIDGIANPEGLPPLAVWNLWDGQIAAHFHSGSGQDITVVHWAPALADYLWYVWGGQVQMCDMWSGSTCDQPENEIAQPGSAMDTEDGSPPRALVVLHSLEDPSDASEAWVYWATDTQLRRHRQVDAAQQPETVANFDERDNLLGLQPLMPASMRAIVWVDITTDPPTMQRTVHKDVVNDMDVSDVLQLDPPEAGSTLRAFGLDFKQRADEYAQLPSESNADPWLYAPAWEEVNQHEIAGDWTPTSLPGSMDSAPSFVISGGILSQNHNEDSISERWPTVGLRARLPCCL